MRQCRSLHLNYVTEQEQSRLFIRRIATERVFMNQFLRIFVMFPVLRYEWDNEDRLVLGLESRDRVWLCTSHEYFRGERDDLVRRLEDEWFPCSDPNQQFATLSTCPPVPLTFLNLNMHLMGFLAYCASCPLTVITNLDFTYVVPILIFALQVYDLSHCNHLQFSETRTRLQRFE